MIDLRRLSINDLQGNTNKLSSHVINISNSRGKYGIFQLFKKYQINQDKDR